MKNNTDALERWFKKAARILPWRKTRDPYSIWISEVMLQQTQVQTVIPYYESFLKEFPTIAALAKAPEREVLRLWSGLGYYSRARNLQKGAQYLNDKHKGIFPLTREECLKIPGIGPYTAGAILSIAFNLREPLVDGNVMRVFARFFGVRKPIEEKQVQKFFWEKAEQWVTTSKEPRNLNQALMELGATLCVKGKPRCALCPLRNDCISFQKQWTEELPLRAPRKKTVDLFWIKLLYQKEEKLLLSQNNKGEWWESLWDFPRLECKNLREVEKQILTLTKKYGSVTPLNRQKHTVTHHKLHVYPVLLKTTKKELGKYYSPQQISNLPLSSLAKKILSSL